MRAISKSFVVFAAIVFFCLISLDAHAQVFQEQSGLLVIEAESVPPTDDWVKETFLGGYTGSGYYRWNGPLLLFDQSQGVITYKINISSAGTYNMRIRSNHPPGEA